MSKGNGEIFFRAVSKTVLIKPHIGAIYYSLSLGIPQTPELFGVMHIPNKDTELCFGAKLPVLGARDVSVGVTSEML
jgi:hypothetical protein